MSLNKYKQLTTAFSTIIEPILNFAQLRITSRGLLCEMDKQDDEFFISASESKAYLLICNDLTFKLFTENIDSFIIFNPLLNEKQALMLSRFVSRTIFLFNNLDKEEYATDEEFNEDINDKVKLLNTRNDDDCIAFNKTNVDGLIYTAYSYSIFVEGEYKVIARVLTPYTRTVSLFLLYEEVVKLYDEEFRCYIETKYSNILKRGMYIQEMTDRINKERLVNSSINRMYSRVNSQFDNNLMDIDLADTELDELE